MNKFMSNVNITLKEIITQLHFKGILRSFKVIQNLINEENIYSIKETLPQLSNLNNAIKLQVNS